MLWFPDGLIIDDPEAAHDRIPEAGICAHPEAMLEGEDSDIVTTLAAGWKEGAGPNNRSYLSWAGLLCLNKRTYSSELSLINSSIYTIYM